jgi:predicted MarR family transcription regulator
MKNLKHIVLFQFHDASAKEEIEVVVNAFLGLKGKVPDLLDIEFGLNISPENFHQDFTHCFTLTFPSMEALSAYQVNTEHLSFQKVLKPHMKKVLVVDYFTED